MIMTPDDQMDLFKPDELPLNNKVQEMSEIAFAILKQEKLVTDLEIQLKDEKKKLDKMKTETLPDIMLSIGLQKFSLADGTEIKIEPKINANIPTLSSIERAQGNRRQELMDRRTFAFKYLRNHHADSLIKTEIKVSLGKNEDELAKKVCNEILRLGIQPRQEETVHAGSLKKFIKEMLADGEHVPTDVFQLYQYKEAKITLPKKQII